MAGTRPSIVEVQYLRAIAVLLVVAGHAYQNEGRFFSDQAFGDFMFFGFSGVDVFFVISGFIIHTLYRDHQGFDPGFYLQRLNRIFPMYWLFTLGAVLGYTLVMGRSLGPVIEGTDWVRTLTLWPANEMPLLPVAWTLTHELYFYLAYAIFLAAPRAWRLPLAGGWLVLTLAGTLLPDAWNNAVLRLVVSPFNWLFLAGALMAEFRARLDTYRIPAGILAVLGAGLGVFWTSRHGIAGLDDPLVRVAVFAPFAIGIVATLLSWKPRFPGFIARIGDGSYVLYLGHALLLDVLARLLAARIDGTAFDSLVFYPTGLIAVLAMAFIAHSLAERPLLKLGKQAIRVLTKG